VALSFEEVSAARVVALRFEQRFDDEAGIECERVRYQQRTILDRVDTTGGYRAPARLGHLPATVHGGCDADLRSESLGGAANRRTPLLGCLRLCGRRQRSHLFGSQALDLPVGLAHTTIVPFTGDGSRDSPRPGTLGFTLAPSRIRNARFTRSTSSGRAFACM
jgi:hypothetical protein